MRRLIVPVLASVALLTACSGASSSRSIVGPVDSGVPLTSSGADGSGTTAEDGATDATTPGSGSGQSGSGDSSAPSGDRPAEPGSAGQGGVAPGGSASGAPGSTTTTAPPIDPALRALLLAALPVAGDLPAAWSLERDEPEVALRPGRGNFVGSCGGANADRRAVDNRALAAAHGPTYTSPAGYQGFVSVYAFPDDASASGFVAQTRSIGSCVRSYSVPEGDAANQYDGFGDAAFDGTTTWEVAESTQVGPAPDAGEWNAVVLSRQDALNTTLGGTTYGAVENSVTLFEQHGRFVLAASLSSYCCTTGYRSGAGTGRVTWDDLAPALAAFRNRVDAARA